MSQRTRQEWGTRLATLDINETPRYLSSMFKKFSQAQINEAERKYWLDVRDHGKARFIWR